MRGYLGRTFVSTFRDLGACPHLIAIIWFDETVTGTVIRDSGCYYIECVSYCSYLGHIATGKKAVPARTSRRSCSSSSSKLQQTATISVSLFLLPQPYPWINEAPERALFCPSFDLRSTGLCHCCDYTHLCCSHGPGRRINSHLKHLVTCIP